MTSSRLPREKIFPEFNAYIYFISQVICYFSPLRVSQVEERQTNVDVRLPVRYLPTFTRTLFVYHIRPPHKVCFPTVQVFQSNIKDVTKKIRIVLALRLGLHRKCTKPNFCTLSTFTHFILIDNYFILSLFGVSYLYFHCTFTHKIRHSPMFMLHSSNSTSICIMNSRWI